MHCGKPRRETSKILPLSRWTPAAPNWSRLQRWLINIAIHPSFLRRVLEEVKILEEVKSKPVPAGVVGASSK